MADNRLPPLSSMRVLEACARNRSFVKAAKELGVTPGAITQHIRTMENWVGWPLFRRTGREVHLTAATETALPVLREGFDRLLEASRLLRMPDGSSSSLTISTLPSFAAKWLLPRLDRFTSLHPDIEVCISPDMKLIDFSNGETDLAIRYGPGGYEGLQTVRLLDDHVLPVAAPSLIAEAGPFREPADVLNAPLLHDVNPVDPSCPDWAAWLRARGVESARAYRGTRYGQASFVVDEAVAGKGVALVKRVIAAADMAAGNLVPLFGDELLLSYAYWLVWPRGRTLLRPVRSFISWIQAEAEKEAARGADRHAA